MSKAFGDYVRSTSFSLNLSRRQVEALLLIKKGGFGLFLQSRMDWGTSNGVVQLVNLAQKGLIKKPEQGNPGWELTEAGELVGKLLDLAEYKLEGDYGDVDEREVQTA